MSCNEHIYKQLIKIGKLPDESIDLFETVLILNSINFSIDNPEAYSRHFVQLCKSTKQYLIGTQKKSNVFQRQEALSQILYKRYGYIGSRNITNGKSVNFFDMIKKRSGCDLMLGILYLSVAQKLKWPAQAISFTKNLFLVRLECRGERLIINPFSGGNSLSIADIRKKLKINSSVEPDFTQFHELNNRKILLELQNKLKLKFLEQNKVEQAISLIEVCKLFAPNDSLLWRETGILYARMNKIKKAISALEKSLRISKNSQFNRDTSALIIRYRKLLRKNAPQ